MHTPTEYAVFFTGPDNGPAFRRVGSLEEAVQVVEHLRNELGVATAIDGSDAQLSDLDAAIAAGRADLVVVDRLPAGLRPRA